jgi:hypothetical protein
MVGLAHRVDVHHLHGLGPEHHGGLRSHAQVIHLLPIVCMRNFGILGPMVDPAHRRDAHHVHRLDPEHHDGVGKHFQVIQRPQ